MPQLRHCPVCQRLTAQVEYAEAEQAAPDDYYQCTFCQQCWYRCRVHGTFTAYQGPYPDSPCACWETPDPTALRLFKVTVKASAYTVRHVNVQTWEHAKALIEQQIDTGEADHWHFEVNDELDSDTCEVIFVDSEDGKETFYEV